ncbi:MAG: cytochrome c [Actinomycetota bacterium]|nr:cytochrome c [Actinomycetota bacterium]
MRFLSSRRRHPFAGLVVLLFALTAVGGLYTALAPGQATADNAQTDMVEEGRQLFVVGCASCHGLAGQGVSTKQGTNYGPSLVGVGAASVDFQVGTGRMPMAKVDTQAPRKAPVYNEEETEALAAYVASLGPGPAIPDEEYLDISGVTDEELSEGGEFFRTNCTACHNSVGAGGALPDGRYAPALTDVEAVHIYEAMLTGPQQMPVFSDEVLTPEDKRNVIAYIKEIENQPSYGGFGMGGIGPVADGVIAWVVGLGALVVAAVWIAAHGVRVEKSE